MTGLVASRRISTRDNTMLKISSWFAVGLMVVLAMPLSLGFTDPQDGKSSSITKLVFAINNLYTALGSPPLPGWIPSAGDPCVEGWQGVQCVISNITAIVLNGANLGGQLGDKLDSFASIITIDLSNNHIGGSIPENLPVTMQRFFLAANQFTGSIPSSLSRLALLSDMSVNDNNLTGELPDAFQSLTGLINLDLSNNLLRGKLPPSMASLSSLTTLHVQNNQLSGTLDVLQDLPLKDLNVENNLFSGPVPANLLIIPNFKKDGNPFNTTIAPSVSPSLSPSSPSPRSGAAVSDRVPANSSDGPSAQENRPRGGKKSFSTIRIVGCVVAAIILVIVAVLLVVFCVSKCQENKSKPDEFFERQDERAYDRLEPKSNEQWIKPNNEAKKASLEETTEGQKKKHAINMAVTAVPKEASEKQNKEHRMEMTGTGAVVMPPSVGKVTVQPKAPSENIKRISSPENLNLPIEKVSVDPVIAAEIVTKTPPHEMLNPPTSVRSFSVASLQQYTNNFSEENVIRDDRFGKVYMAELPGGKLLAVMKVDNVNAKIPVAEFLELVLSISELHHPNIVELVGYCAEFDQRLLVYNYSCTKSLHDVLHRGDDLKKRLSWNARLRMALGAAKALEYLHEGCQPPVVHQNFESANVLLDDEFNIRVFECGLAPLLSSNSVTQLSGRMQALYSYEAPEINESELYTDKSDVYSFGVVMLELLTGRKPYDSSRPRAEQHLVRWASSQLHDINTLSNMVDPSIAGRFPEKSLSRFADIISCCCIQQGPEFRPAMSQVVQDLTLMVEESQRRGNRGSHRV